MLKKIICISVILSLAACGAEDETADTEVVVDKSVNISEDAYYAASFTLTRDADIKVHTELVTGPAVETYFLDQEGYDVWLTAVSNGQYTEANFSYYQEFSRQPLATTFTSDRHRVSSGSYYLLIENTNYGNTAPPFNGVDDIATVEVKIEVNP
jgi:hypothetical protein